jgi:anthranilate phosphoribosyltransferase
VRRQLIGVFDPALTETVANVLATLGSEKVFVVHGLDGSDEVSVTADTRVSALEEGRVETFTFAPETVGVERHRQEDIAGGTPAENAEIIRSVLGGTKGPRRDAVLVNAGFVICVAGKAPSVQRGVEVAATAIDSGRARAALESLQKISAEYAVA